MPGRGRDVLKQAGREYRRGDATGERPYFVIGPGFALVVQRVAAALTFECPYDRPGALDIVLYQLPYRRTDPSLRPTRATSGSTKVAQGITE